MSTLDLEESGFQVKAPHPAFRFADLVSYRSLTPKGLKEMDVGWWEANASGQRLILLELKGARVWQTPPDDPARPHEYLINTCVTKATDALLMLACAWIPTTWGQSLQAELPLQAVLDSGCSIWIVFLIDIPEGYREHLLMVREELNARLAGRLALFGIRRVSVVDLAGAAKLGLPVTRL